MTQVVHLGRLSDRSWIGKVSADDVYIDIPSIQTRLDEFYVAVNPSAKTRCIDGRYDLDIDETCLGPQVPGGATGAALAYRLAVDKDDLVRGTFYNDFETMLGIYARLGLTPGGHRDDNGSGDKVGCGAIDSIDKVLACLTDPRLVDDHKRLVRTLLGAEFDRDHYLRILGAAQVLGSRAKEFFSGADRMLELLEARFPKSVSHLHGEHNEKIVIINAVADTTLASTRFADNNGGVQAFGYDIWRSKQMAKLLMPLPYQAIDRERFITARVAITIATLMTLTDGSLQLVMRLP